MLIPHTHIPPNLVYSSLGQPLHNLTCNLQCWSRPAAGLSDARRVRYAHAQISRCNGEVIIIRVGTGNWNELRRRLRGPKGGSGSGTMDVGIHEYLPTCLPCSCLCLAFVFQTTCFRLVCGLHPSSLTCPLPPLTCTSRLVPARFGRHRVPLSTAQPRPVAGRLETQ